MKPGFNCSKCGKPIETESRQNGDSLTMLIYHCPCGGTGGPKTPNPGTMPDRIRALIESTPLSTWTIREVADYYGIQENAARAHLSVLQSAGLVRRVPVSFGPFEK
jgi:hypothetical protein